MLSFNVITAELEMRPPSGVSVITLTGVDGSLTCADPVPIAIALNSTGSTISAANTSTLTLSGACFGPLSVNAAHAAVLAIPAACTSVTINCANLVTISSIGALDAALTSFACTVAKLSAASVGAALAACDATGSSSGIFDTSGGTSASPTLDGAARQAQVDVTFPDASALNGSGDGSWFKPPGTVGFWFNVSGGNTAPVIGGVTFINVDVDVLDGATAVRDAAANVLSLNGYNPSSGNPATIIRNATGTTSAASQDAASFTFANEDDGANAFNSHVASLVGKSWTVTTN